MFWRRRKLPEDEPLVPHGLISQAMENQGSSELPPDMLESPNDVKRSPAEPVEMRLRVSPPADERFPESQALPEQGKISPPLKWPRLDEAEIARRAQGIDTAVSFPYRKPILSAALPEMDEFEPDEESTEPAQLEVLQTSPEPPPIAEAPPAKRATLISKVNQFRMPHFAPARQRIGGVLSQAGTSTSRTFRTAIGQLHAVRAKTGVAVDAAKLGLLNTSQKAIAQSSSGLQYVRERIRGLDLSYATHIWDLVRSWKVTVRIPVANKQFISSLIAHPNAPQVREKGVLRRDSRLSASLGMAALSALLALGLISAVRRYGPDRVEAQPTSKQAMPPATPTVTSSSLVPSTASIVARTADPKPSRIDHVKVMKQITAATPPNTQKKPAAASPKKPRVRHKAEEDDFIAKDTYVFYGNAGKPRK